MSPEHDNNLQPTLEMSAPESSSDAPQTAASAGEDSPREPAPQQLQHARWTLRRALQRLKKVRG